MRGLRLSDRAYDRRADRVAEAQFMREQLEFAIVRETAHAIDGVGLATLARILRRRREASRENNPDLFLALDEKLHASFAAIVGRPGNQEGRKT